MAEIKLLPRKEFEIILDDKTVINGQFSLWSVKRYTDKKGLSLSGLGEQMGMDKISFDDICELLLCAVEFTSRKNKKGFAFTDLDVCEWIEQLGGLESEKYAALMNHAKSEDDTPEGEKKNQ